MKKLKVNPLQARVKGNIIPDWDEVLTKTQFEDFHVSREKINNITWNGKERRAIRLNSYGEKVILTVTTDHTSILPDTETATLSISATYQTTENNQTMTYPVQYQQVYIYDNNKLIATGATSAEGTMTFEYIDSFSGLHELTIKTSHGNGFEASTKKINIIVKYITRLDINPIGKYDLGFGEVKELLATLYDNDNNPVADKPVVFREGYRELGTFTTDKNGQAKVMYMESNNRGTPTKIEIINNPTIYENVYSVFVGKITDNVGTPLANKNVALYHEYSGYWLEFGTSDSTGRFNIRYNPKIVDIPVHYYFAYGSNIADTTNNQYVNYEPTFTALGDKITIERPEYMEDISSDIITLRSDEGNNHWYINRVYSNDDNMSSATSHAPSVVAGNYDCGVNTNLYQSLPYGENWIIRLTCEITGDTSIVYNNVVDGSLTLSNGNNGFKIYDNTHNYNNGTSVSPFTNSTVTVNTLYLIREGNDITFKYTSATGEQVQLTKHYTDLSLVGSLYIRVANGSCVLHELQMIETEELTNNIALPIWNQSLLESYTDDSQQQGHTSYTMNDDGTINVGQREWILYPITLDTSKEYTIYTYNTQRYDNVGLILYNGTNYLNNYGRSLIALNTDSTSINGVNKTRIFFNGGKMYYQLNSNAQIQISNIPTGYAKYYLGTRAISTDEKLLSLTEQTGGGNSE